MKWFITAFTLTVGANDLGAQPARWDLGGLLFAVGSESDPNAQFTRIVNVLLRPDSGVAFTRSGVERVIGP